MIAIVACRPGVVGEFSSKRKRLAMSRLPRLPLIAVLVSLGAVVACSSDPPRGDEVVPPPPLVLRGRITVLPHKWIDVEMDDITPPYRAACRNFVDEALQFYKGWGAEARECDTSRVAAVPTMPGAFLLVETHRIGDWYAIPTNAKARPRDTDAEGTITSYSRFGTAEGCERARKDGVELQQRTTDAGIAELRTRLAAAEQAPQKASIEREIKRLETQRRTEPTCRPE
jgi:hypothetical protein